MATGNQCGYHRYMKEAPIRQMVPGDLPGVLEIEEASFTGPWTAAGFLVVMERKNVASYVYTRGKKVLAYFFFNFYESDTHIMNLAVRPGYRRQGIALECLRFAERLARHRRALRITLEVEESNLPAQLLYRKAGYRATRILRNYYSASNEDGYRMVRLLSETAAAAP